MRFLPCGSGEGRAKTNEVMAGTTSDLNCMVAVSGTIVVDLGCQVESLGSLRNDLYDQELFGWRMVERILVLGPRTSPAFIQILPVQRLAWKSGCIRTEGSVKLAISCLPNTVSWVVCNLFHGG